MTELTKVSVVVPTYRRPEVLQNCLNALASQGHSPFEVLVCRRQTDERTAAALAGLPQDGAVREVVVGPDDNFAKALNAGIMASHGELVALTDDDAEAPADWIERLVRGFDAPDIAGVGGRDIIEDASPTNPVVGKVQWFGRVIGNHHVGTGSAREVDIVKGVNCCFRGDLIRAVGVDSRLVGAGTVIHTEMSLCLPLRRAGYRIVYDPTITVLHHAAPRGDGDQINRGGFNANGFENIVHNETVQLLDHLSLGGRAAFLVWSALVGTAFAPGLLQTPRAIRVHRNAAEALKRAGRQAIGRLRGVGTCVKHRRDWPSADGRAPSRLYPGAVG